MKRFDKLPCRVNDAILLVSEYQEGQLSGQLIHPRLDSPETIKNIPQLLFLLDDLLQQEQRLISNCAFQGIGLEDIPRLATLRIQILFREHHTWQGLLTWEEQKVEASFRSVLELVQILDEILTA